MRNALQSTLDHVIANGAAIAEQLSGLGSIVPTEAEMRRDERFCRIQKERALREAEKELTRLAPRTVGGEERFYLTDTVYTPAVTRRARRVWFETRADGDYSISDPREK